MMDKLIEEQNNMKSDSLEPFQYEEEYNLVKEHLRLVAAAATTTDCEVTAAATADGDDRMVDEEWSSDEEGHEDIENKTSKIDSNSNNNCMTIDV